GDRRASSRNCHGKGVPPAPFGRVEARAHVRAEAASGRPLDRTVIGRASPEPVGGPTAGGRFEVDASHSRGAQVGDGNLQINYFASAQVVEWPVAVGLPPREADAFQVRLDGCWSPPAAGTPRSPVPGRP